MKPATKGFGPFPPLFKYVDGVLRPMKRALTPGEKGRVGNIPGARVDHETGEVEGQDHALWTVAKVFGAEGYTPPNTAMKEPLFPKSQLAPFQQVGAFKLARVAEDGALCHDDMGLGKTVQAVAAACTFQWHKHAKLVLCPAFLRPQWTSEIRRWTESFDIGRAPAPVLEMRPGDKHRTYGDPYAGSVAPWVVAYYHDAERAMDFMQEQGLSYLLVFDEAHNLRGYKTERTESVHAAATFAAGRIALTGDLLVNNAAKLHPVLNLIQPGAFGNYKSFIRRYASASENDLGYLVPGKLSNEAELRERMKFFAYRRTWDDIPNNERPFETKMQTTWVEVRKGHAALRSFLVKGVALMRYAEALADAKMEATIDLLRNEVGAGIPSLVFTLTKKHASELVEAVRSKECQPLLIHSEVANADKRLAKVAEYVHRESVAKRLPMVIATLGSLKEGANLQWAKCVTFAALPFGPDEIRQGLARAARMGNTGTITVRFIVAKGTGDQYFVDLMKHKLKEQMALAGTSESAKVDLNKALSFTKTDVENVLEKMYAAARAKGEE
jgi:hypothetical protein